MKINKNNISRIIRDLLESQRLAVLTTVKNDQPHTSLMAFIFSDDLKELIVATGTSTRKYQNIVENPKVSLLVDNRTEVAADFSLALALSIFGKAQPLEASRQDECAGHYLFRHPALKFFLDAESTVLLRIEVSHYSLVSEFQNVTNYHLV